MDGIQNDVDAANGAFVLFEIDNETGDLLTAEECRAVFEGYGLTNEYYVAGVPSQFDASSYPFTAVIDLNTGVLVGGSIESPESLTAEAVLGLVQAANGG